MKLWLKILLYAIVAATIAILSVAYTANRRHLIDIRVQVAHQSAIIDSLLARRMTVVDAQMYVTDKSKNTIYGKYNEGVIQMPSVKEYKLDVDSILIKQ